MKNYPNFLKETLSEILNESGAVYYSSIETLKPGKILILGLNPGVILKKLNLQLKIPLKNLLTKNTMNILKIGMKEKNIGFKKI